jgi:hypothetical protein
MGAWLFQPTDYGGFAPLLSAATLAPLGPGTPRQELRSALRDLDWKAAFGERRIVDRDAARCCLAAVWLAHDFLDESHTLSQDIATVEGSYWHGIMHRREPDYGNAKYWFRRVGSHAIFSALAEQAAALAAQQPLDGAGKFLTAADAWDPFRFIDLCEAIARGRSSLEALARQIAAVEFQVLFAHCWRQAIGE